MNKFISALAAASTLAIATPALADGGLTFQIVGDTFGANYTITNTSTAGERVTGFGVTLVAPFGFDTETDGFGFNQAFAFAPQNGTDALTGYTGASSFAEGTSSIDFTFNDFQIGESFIWKIDVDSPSTPTVFGSDLIGSTGYADFSNGLRGIGKFEALGGDGSQFVISTFTPIPGGVPEPATWALMILGMGAVGGAMRRRAANTAVRFA